MIKENNEICNDEAVGKRIRSLRDSKGITQEYLSEIFGANVETIRNYETGKSKIPSDRLALLVKILDTTADYILYGDQQENDMKQLIEKFNCLEKSFKSLEKIIIEKIIIN
ncbi:helix-turn-helix domain-containing protein [Mediterraneibacter gnavus]|uniref:helix-turn-helix domain-containing protein n=1 Tax=Mediterraneibacter gnavus TaxID=33038 RepID=UPI000E4C8C80|nr:XRE family transcriptional regulator [Mediterraneibacter gnavus]